MNVFERYLTLWVAACIVAGSGLGHLLPDLFQAVGRMEVVQVNLPVVKFVNASRGWYERGARVSQRRTPMHCADAAIAAGAPNRTPKQEVPHA